MRVRWLLPIFAVALVGCGQNQADFTRIGDRMFRIESPPIAGGAEGPNLRLAKQLCPGGFRRLTEESHKGGPDRVDWYEHGTTTIWVVKCI